MDRIVINKGRNKQYIFSSEGIFVKKKNNEIHNIPMTDILLITYSSKPLIVWLFQCMLCNVTVPPPPRSFGIRKRGAQKRVVLWIKKKDFYRIKDLLQCPIEIL